MTQTFQQVRSRPGLELSSTLLPSDSVLFPLLGVFLLECFVFKQGILAKKRVLDSFHFALGEVPPPWWLQAAFTLALVFWLPPGFSQWGGLAQG